MLPHPAAEIQPPGRWVVEKWACCCGLRHRNPTFCPSEGLRIVPARMPPPLMLADRTRCCAAQTFTRSPINRQASRRQLRLKIPPSIGESHRPLSNDPNYRNNTRPHQTGTGRASACSEIGQRTRSSILLVGDVDRRTRARRSASAWPPRTSTRAGARFHGMRQREEIAMSRTKTRTAVRQAVIGRRAILKGEAAVSTIAMPAALPRVLAA